MSKGLKLIGAAAVYCISSGAAFMYYKAQQTIDEAEKAPLSTIEQPNEKKQFSVFERLAASYDSDIGFHETVSLIQRRRIQLISQASGSVLEVACGTGRNLAHYRDISSLVLADFSPEMLRIARSKTHTLKNLNGKRVGVKRCSTGALPFESDSFDTVVETFGLCSYSDPEAALVEMSRVCRPDGMILLIEHGQAHYPWLNRFLAATANSHASKWGCFWNRDVLALVTAAPMEVTRVQRYLMGTLYVIQARPVGKDAQTEDGP